MDLDELKRRGYLGGMAAGLAGLAGCGGDGEPTEEPTRSGTGTGTTTESVEPTGTGTAETTPRQSLPGHDHSGPDAGGGALSPAQVTTGQLLNEVGDRPIQAAFDGLVVPVGEGLGMDSAVDPTTTETPVQDAIDAIGAGGGQGNRGAVLLPPGVVDENGSLTGTRGKSFLGWGVQATRLRFTALDEPGITQDPTIARDAGYTYWDGIRFEGNAGAKKDATRTAPAVHLRQSDETRPPDAIRAFNVGHVRFEDWNDPVIHLDGATLFESHWTWVDMNSFNTGRNVLVEDTSLGGSSWTVDKLNLGRETPGRLFDARDARGGRFHVQNLHFRDNAAGTSDAPVIDIAGPTNLQVTVAQAEYETPDADLPCVFRLRGGARYDLGQIQYQVDRLAVDHLIRLQRANDATVGQFDLGGDIEVREAPLGLVGDQPFGTVLFHGRSDEVDNAVGSRRGRVFALADRRVADPLFADTVTHDGDRTRITGVNRAQDGAVIGEERRRFTPHLQRLRPVSMPEVSYGVDHRFEWRTDDDFRRWDLVLEWTLDPGQPIDFEVEVTRRGTGH